MIISLIAFPYMKHLFLLLSFYLLIILIHVLVMLQINHVNIFGKVFPLVIEYNIFEILMIFLVFHNLLLDYYIF